MEVQGKFKMQAHRLSGVVIDIAAFKVSHSVDSNCVDTAALRAARVRLSSIAAARARSSSIGAMEEMSQKVQNTSTHIL